MQKRVNIAGQKLLFLERQGAMLALACVWELEFQERFHHSLVRMAHVPKAFMQTIWFVLNICFPS